MKTRARPRSSREGGIRKLQRTARRLHAVAALLNTNVPAEFGFYTVHLLAQCNGLVPQNQVIGVEDFISRLYSSP
jgi:hypothetical protein